MQAMNSFSSLLSFLPCAPPPARYRLQSEHERYLTEEVYRAPIILYNYPKDIKAFYMRLNDDGKTVAAMDVLVPKVRGPGGAGLSTTVF